MRARARAPGSGINPVIEIDDRGSAALSCVYAAGVKSIRRRARGFYSEARVRGNWSGEAGAVEGWLKGGFDGVGFGRSGWGASFEGALLVN